MVGSFSFKVTAVFSGKICGAPHGFDARIEAVIGQAHPRLGGERFVKGAARFVEDVRIPGMLHAAVLRSPHAHARLVSIDAKRARDLPGVRAVLTAADVPATAIIPNRVPAPKGTDRYLQPAIARDVVRYVGEPVALVVAEDAYIARDALERIDVVYEPLAACVSTGEALAAGAARLFPGTDSNNVATIGPGSGRPPNAPSPMAQSLTVLLRTSTCR